MDRRIGTAAAVVALIVTGCGLGTASPAPSQSIATVAPTTATTPTPAASATSVPGWTPGATVTLGATSTAPLGDFVATRIASTPAGFALIGQDGSQAPFFLSGSADGGSWSRLDATAFGGYINDLAAGPRGAVLAARDTSGDTGHLWFSTDGLTWGRIDQPAGLTKVAVVALSAGGAGFALAGDDGSGDDATPTVWTSSNGHDWQEAIPLRGSGIAQVIVLDDGFVAIESPDSGPGLEVSADGTTWRAVPATDLGPIDLDAELAASVGSTVVVIRGAGADGGIDAWAGTMDPVAGTIAWQQAADAGFGRADFVSLTGGAAGATLLGYDRTSFEPVTWTTSDGLTWTRHDLAPGALGGGASALLATSGTTTVSLGWTSDAEDRVLRALWRSDDGAAWMPVESGLFGRLDPLSRSQCPAVPPATARQLVAVAGVLAPFCFGDQRLTVTGYVVDCGGCGGTSPMNASPSWLIDPLGYSRFWLSPTASGNSGTGVGVDVDPAHPIRIPADRTKVRLMGHFDDPAAATCRLTPSAGNGAELPPPAVAILQCREKFVATGVTVLGS